MIKILATGLGWVRGGTGCQEEWKVPLSLSSSKAWVILCIFMLSKSTAYLLGNQDLSSNPVLVLATLWLDIQETT